MIISEKQQEANRKNAQHSSGPKTPAGKEAIRFNALTYGLRTRASILPDENAADYSQLWDEMEADWQPQTRTERCCLETMVTSQWLLKRVAESEQRIYVFIALTCGRGLCGSLSAHFQSRLPGKRRVSRRDELLEAKQQNSAKRVSRSEAVGHAFAESPHPELVQIPDTFGMRVVFWQPNYGEVRACVQINVAFQNIAEDLLSVRLFNLDCDRSALSPLTNHRTDEYGGAFDGRIRLALEVAAAVRAAWPDSLPLFMRISAIDWVEDGWQLQDSVELARRLRPLGVDLMDSSSGGVVPHARMQIGPAYQTPFAERIRRESGILTGAVGMITEAHQADGIIRAGQADIVLLAREFLRDPYWPLHAAKALGASAGVPKQYRRAFV